MTDIETAVKNLKGHSICLCRGADIITDDGKGIAPMMMFIAAGRDFSGYSCADAVVGKAAAMLFVKTGIAHVYGTVMSRAAKKYLEERGIPAEFGALSEEIQNRFRTGICPMEAAVAGEDDPERGYIKLKETIAKLSSGREGS